MGRRSAAVTVSLVAAVSLAMTGCGAPEDDDPDYRGVCVDEQTQQRVDDDECDDGHGHHSVVFFHRGSTVPPVGSRVSGGSARPPAGASSARGGAPRQGGTVRGGFGGSGAKGGGGKGGSVGG